MSLIFKKNRREQPGVEAEKRSGDHPWDADGQEVLPGGGGDNGEPLDFTVNALCGASSGSFQLAGQTVGGARKFLEPILNIEPGAIALVNGKEADEGRVLNRHDQLEFVKRAGEKGGGHARS